MLNNNSKNKVNIKETYKPGKIRSTLLIVYFFILEFLSNEDIIKNPLIQKNIKTPGNN